MKPFNYVLIVKKRQPQCLAKFNYLELSNLAMQAIMINFQKYPPSNEIKNYINSYFIISSGTYNKSTVFDENLSPSLTNHPQGTLDLMFVLQGRGIKLVTKKNETYKLSDIFLMAQQEAKFDITFAPDSYIFGIVFNSESFSKFFNLPLSEFTNSGAVLIDEIESDYLILNQKLKECKTDKEIINLANVFIKNQLSQIDYKFDKFDKLISHIRNTNGQIPIDQISSLANLSNRSIQRKMKETIGLSPKSYSNTMRFRYVMDLIINQPNYDWQDVLFNSGYYDQAHFIKDFKKFTGHSPTNFLKEKITLSEFFESNKK